VSKLIFVQLNEVNFDLVRHYVFKYDELPSLKRLLTEFKRCETYGEDRYEDLEPWIQWVSAQTGMNYQQHGVFRLGDIVGLPREIKQVFERLEDKGLSVGAISPMNARNSLDSPAYFIPDPWTDTPSDPSRFSMNLTSMLRQTVNDNATGKISPKSYLTLLECTLRSFSFPRTLQLARLVFRARRKPWTKSLILDYLIHLVHLHLWQLKKPDVSFVFLNAGAHIQHHYFFNSEFGGSPQLRKNPSWYVPASADPVRDMLKVYDEILADYITESRNGARLILATGLTQVPYDQIKYYYRLKDHENFLREAGIRFEKVLPRMTRDFEVIFRSEEDAISASTQFASFRLEKTGQPLFGEIEVRKHSVFVTLTYRNEIGEDDCALHQGASRMERFGKMVAFVAIKNGMHDKRGFVFVSPDAPVNLPKDPVSVTYLHDLTLQLSNLPPHR
jgi:hypothetical protein